MTTPSQPGAGESIEELLTELTKVSTGSEYPPEFPDWFKLQFRDRLRTALLTHDARVTALVVGKAAESITELFLEKAWQECQYAGHESFGELIKKKIRALSSLDPSEVEREILEAHEAEIIKPIIEALNSETKLELRAFKMRAHLISRLAILSKPKETKCGNVTRS